jgi:hypothetical protein
LQGVQQKSGDPCRVHVTLRHVELCGNGLLHVDGLGSAFLIFERSTFCLSQRVTRSLLVSLRLGQQRFRFDSDGCPLSGFKMTTAEKYFANLSKLTNSANKYAE